MMRMILVAVVLAAVILSPLPSAAPADADMGTKAMNTGINLALGWLECPKAIWNEALAFKERFYVGPVVSGPVLCGVNTGIRYGGVAGDIVTFPLGDNLIKPNALDRKGPVSPLYGATKTP